MTNRLAFYIITELKKTKSMKEIYQCILVDGKKKKVIDILPDRYQSHLISYFTKYSRQERKNVKFFVCDMWQQYAELAKTLFPNATIIIDKYHFIRQTTWALKT